MEFPVEKKISNFIESQFPQFYLEEGDNFILFVKAYYEWLESAYAVNKSTKVIISKDAYYKLSEIEKLNYTLYLNPIHQARDIFNIRDIDNTLIDFLEHFQRKYLYGIPFKIIVDKRLLLKHIFDVYRSKGSIQCYKLLFKLIYNQDIDIYIPGEDILKPSDGTWSQPQYLEISYANNITNLVGKTIIGASSNTTATVESYITEPISENIISTLYISNIQPKGGVFSIREKIVEITKRANTEAVANAPTILGSLDSLSIFNGGRNFSIGDVIKIARRDPLTNRLVTNGIDGKLKVTKVSSAIGALKFDTVRGGFGYTNSSHTFVYNGVGDNTGVAAEFQLDNLINNETVTYNTDLIVDYLDLALDSTTFNFPANSVANISSVIQTSLKFQSNVFGSVSTFKNVYGGNSYTNTAFIFVRETLNGSNALPGTVTYNTSSNVVTGYSTFFQGNSDIIYFQANDVIRLQADSMDPSTVEYQVIKNVISNTSIELYGPPYFNTLAGTYKNSPVTFVSNFGINEQPYQARPDATINGINEIVTGTPSIGANVIVTTKAIDSGKSYIEDENIIAYLYNSIAQVTIMDGGTQYANNESLIISGGAVNTPAGGYVSTNSTGGITSVTLTNVGSNYNFIPIIRVNSANGYGAILKTDLVEFDTNVKITGKVRKVGIGVKEGYWSTSRSFLNSDKYIQDSEFYQDYSYQIRAGLVLDKYKDILYNTFHIAGTELFGLFYNQIFEESIGEIINESTHVAYISIIPPRWDTTLITFDDAYITMDSIP
jgi:hypothetical protein